MDYFIPIFRIAIYIVNFFIILNVLFSKKSPAKTISWLLVLYFIPTLGFVLYLFFGINWRKRKVLRRLFESSSLFHSSDKTDDLLYQKLETIPEAMNKIHLIHIAKNTTRLSLTWNNDIHVYHDTSQALTAIEDAIRQARHHIHIEFYTIKPDETGHRFKALLLEKANEGIQIRLIIDGIGSHQALRGDFPHELFKHENIFLSPFRKVLFPQINLKANYRNHRKLVVVDGLIGFIGGMNIGDDYLGLNARFGYWRDTVLRLEGDAVHNIQTIFFQDWYFTRRQKLPRNIEFFPNSIHREYGNTLTHIVANSPHSNWDAIAQMYFEAIATANKSLFITSPYLIPDESLLMALKTASTGGCSVKILIPGKADHFFSYHATNSYLEELLLSGIEVYTYDENSFIHSKVITVDGTLTSVGSANVDQRSMNINFEINAFIYNKKLTEMMDEAFLNDLNHSQRITLEDIRLKPLWTKGLEAFARLFSPIL